MSMRFPRTLAYIAKHPGGLAAYPDLRVHRAGLGDVRDIIPPPYDELPEPLAAFFRGDLQDEWLPEVLGQSTTMTICDIHGEDYLVEASRELAEKLYSGPIFRHLVRILSPTLLVMGTQRRWGETRKGSTMSSTPVVKDGRWSQTEISVEAPHPVFTDPFARALAPFLELAIESSRGGDPQVRITASEPTRIVYEGRWSS